MQESTNKIKNISKKELKNLDLKEIQYLTLVDGSIVYINNSKSSQIQSDLISSQAKPLLIPIQHSKVQTQYNYSKEGQKGQNFTQGYEYYQQNEDINQTTDGRNLKSGGQPKLKNNNGQLLNDMITYNDQGNSNCYDTYQGQEQTQEGEQYYNNGEGGLVEQENGYEQQQNNNYYMDQQKVYEQNVEGHRWICLRRLRSITISKWWTTP